jgi:hypothetical protein
MDDNTTRYAIEGARRQQKMTGNAQKVRPILSGKSQIDIIKAKSWVNVSQAAPAVVQPLNSALKAYSNHLGNYTSTTNGLKAIINFEKTITVPASILWADFILGLVNSGALSALQWDCTAVGGGTYGGNLACYAMIKLTPIVAPFVTANLTWNNVVVAPSLTYAAATEYYLIVLSGPPFFTISVTHFPINRASFDQPDGPTRRETPISYSLRLSSYPAGLCGYQIEVYPFLTVTDPINGGSVTVNSIFSSMEWINTAPDAPYLTLVS